MIMKIIDENGRLFKKISILDIVIVLTILFLGIIFILSKGDKIAVPVTADSNVGYTVKFKAYTIDKGARSPFDVGDKLYGYNGELIGEITEVEEKAMITKEKLQDGTYFDCVSQQYVDYFITVKGTGTSNDKGTFAEGTFALYPNNSVSLTSRNFCGTAVVLSVEKNA